MNDEYYYTAHDIAEIVKISDSSAYRIIIKLNNKLKKMGKMTFRGRVPIRFFRREFGIED